MEEPVDKQVTLKTPAAKRIAEAQSIIEKELIQLEKCRRICNKSKKRGLFTSYLSNKKN